MCSSMRYQGWGKGFFAELRLEVQRWVSTVFGQNFLDHPISILFLFNFISFVPLGFTSWVKTLGKPHKCCTQDSNTHLIKTKDLYFT